jgi:uncharacterized protein YkwD
MRSLPLFVLLACASAGPAPTIRTFGDEISALEHDVARLVNEHRAARRLPALMVDSAVAAIARAHSAAMAQGRISLGHDGFTGRAERVEAFLAFKQIAENVALNDYPPARTVRVAVEGWLRSAHHRENIEGPFEKTGVGIARARDGTFFYTQLFVATARGR